MPSIPKRHSDYGEFWEICALILQDQMEIRIRLRQAYGGLGPYRTKGAAPEEKTTPRPRSNPDLGHPTVPSDGVRASNVVEAFVILEESPAQGKKPSEKIAHFCG